MPTSKLYSKRLFFALIILFFVDTALSQVVHKFIEAEKLRPHKESINSGGYKIQATSQSGILDSIRVTYDIKHVETGCRAGEVIIPPGTKTAFVLVQDDYKILVIDIEAAQVIDSILLPQYPHQMILNHAGTQIYVSTWEPTGVNREIDCAGMQEAKTVGPGEVFVIEVSTKSIVNQIFPIANSEYPFIIIYPFSQILLSKDNTKLFMIGSSDYIYCWDLVNRLTSRVIKSLNRGFEYAALGFNDNRICINTTLYTSSGVILEPVIVDIQKSTVTQVDYKGEKHYAYAHSYPQVSPDGNTFYTSSYDSAAPIKGMIAIDAETAELKKYIKGLTTENQFIYSPDSSFAYINEIELTRYGWPSLLASKRAIFDFNTMEKIGNIPGGSFSCVMSADKQRLFFSKYSPGNGGVTNYAEPVIHTLTVTNLKTNINYPIPIYPTRGMIESGYHSLAVSDDNAYIVISNDMFNTISIISNLQELSPVPPALFGPANNSTDLPLTLNFSWIKPETALKYHIQVSDSITFNNLLIEDSSLTSLTHNVNLPQPNTNYYWRVRAWNLAGWGEWSEPYNFKTMDLPAQSINSLPQDKETCIPVTPILSWAKIPDTVSYELLISDDESFSNFVFCDSLITDTLKQLSGLGNDKQYFWKVRAKNAAGYGEFSAPWSFYTIVQKPGIVVLNLPADNTIAGVDSIMFTWNSSQPSVEKYWFELAGDSLFTNAIVDSALTDTSTSHSGLKEQKYWWRVRAFNVAGWSDFSNANEFNILLTGVEPDRLPAAYSLSQNYPNPFNPSTQIKYSLKEAGHVTLFIYNMLGEKVSELVNQYQPAGSYELMFKNDNIPSGVYLYIIISGSFSETRKMMLIR